MNSRLPVNSKKASEILQLLKTLTLGAYYNNTACDSMYISDSVLRLCQRQANTQEIQLGIECVYNIVSSIFSTRSDAQYRGPDGGVHHTPPGLRRLPPPGEGLGKEGAAPAQGQ